MTPVLDPQFFPHIFESILLESLDQPDSWNTLCNARLVCTGMRTIVDRLPLRVLFLLPRAGNPQLGAERTGVRCAARMPNGALLPLPAFYSNGVGGSINDVKYREELQDCVLGESQKVALSYAEELFVDEDSLGDKYAEMVLSHLPRGCSLYLFHDWSSGADWDVCLPPMAALDITFSGCICIPSFALPSSTPPQRLLCIWRTSVSRFNRPVGTCP